MTTASEIIREHYHNIIKNKYPELCAAWPIVSGHNLINGPYGSYIICIFKHTGNNGMMASSVVDFTPTNTGVDVIDDSNIDRVREKIRSIFYLSNMDSVVILATNGSNLNSELEKLLESHEVIMGLKK